jgi:hypothetical protein
MVNIIDDPVCKYYELLSGSENSILHIIHQLKSDLSDCNNTINVYALEKLDFLAKNITNPSEKIMLALLEYDKNIFNIFKNPTKDVMRKYLEMCGDVNILNKYSNLFTQLEISQMIYKNPQLIKFLYIRNQTHNIITTVLAFDPYCVKYLDQGSRESVKYITFAVINWIRNKKNKLYSSTIYHFPDISWKAYDGSGEWQILINTMVSAGELEHIPVQCISEQQLIIGIKNTDSYLVKNYITMVLNFRDDIEKITIYQEMFDKDNFTIDHIPYEFQTDQMIDKVLSNINSYNAKILNFMKKTDNVIEKMIYFCDKKDIQLKDSIQFKTY